MRLSEKLVLGTAQFGQTYGVTNSSGQVPKAEVDKILTRAREAGMSFIDTASSYGESELVLGEVGVEDFDIMTKIPSIANKESIGIDYLHEDSIRSSLKHLGISRLDTVYLHAPNELLGPYGDEIYRSLLNLKDRGQACRIGVSIYSPDILAEIISKFAFDVVQVPTNIFDQRIVKSGWLSKLKSRGVSVVARSIFLQGVLLSDPLELPNYFNPWIEAFLDWQNFCKDHSVSPLHASLASVAQNSEIDNIIVGVEDVAQLNDILGVLEMPTEMRFETLAVSDEHLIDPTNWKI